MADKKIDRRTLLAKGAAFAALLVTGCARKESRGFAATSLRQLRARLERHIEPGFAPGMGGPVASGPEVETFVPGKITFEGPDMRRDYNLPNCPPLHAQQDRTPDHRTPC